MNENLAKYQDAFVEAFEIEDKNILIDLNIVIIMDSITMALMAI